MYIDIAKDYNSLYEAYCRVRKVSGWKSSVQKIGINLLPQIQKMSAEIGSGYVPGKPTIFTICERGNLRLVRALKQEDMMMQHALCQSVLIPILSRYLIHDNGASLTGKGIAFTRRRFEQHLRWHHRRYGTSGYVLKIDFRKYFDNINHAKLLKAITDRIPDVALAEMISNILQSNCPNVSYDERSIDELMKIPFSSLEHNKTPPDKMKPVKYLPKSLGIGSPLSQIAGIFFPTRIDNYCKTVKGLHCYDAYMDDRIIIHPDKEYLKQLLKEIKVIADEMGLFVHPHKTQIIKLSHGVTFLKTKYNITSSGKIIRRLSRETIVCERRKLKKLASMVVRGRMPLKKYDEAYRSWRGGQKRYRAHRSLKNMDNLYKELRIWILQQKKYSSCSSRKSISSVI